MSGRAPSVADWECCVLVLSLIVCRLAFMAQTQIRAELITNVGVDSGDSSNEHHTPPVLSRPVNYTCLVLTYILVLVHI